MTVLAAQSLNGALRRVPTWPVYLFGALLPVWYLYLGLTGGLGVEPINALERLLGQAGLLALMASLLVTPLRRFTGVSLLKFRRAIGLVAFYFISCHLLVWLVLDVQVLGDIWKDIVKRPYITIGMTGFVLLIPLALTSNAWSIRKLGAERWRQVHKLAYVAVILGAVHFVMVAKGWQLEPLLYLAAAIGLLGLRFDGFRRSRRSG